MITKDIILTSNFNRNFCLYADSNIQTCYEPSLHDLTVFILDPLSQSLIKEIQLVNEKKATTKMNIYPNIPEIQSLGP